MCFCCETFAGTLGIGRDGRYAVTHIRTAARQSGCGTRAGPGREWLSQRAVSESLLRRRRDSRLSSAGPRRTRERLDRPATY